MSNTPRIVVGARRGTPGSLHRLATPPVEAPPEAPPETQPKTTPDPKRAPKEPPPEENPSFQPAHIPAQPGCPNPLRRIDPAPDPAARPLICRRSQ